MAKRKERRGISMTPELRAAPEAQRAAFREKFGRDPGPDDPVFFDREADQPRALTKQQITDEMVRLLVRAGVRPEIIYAYRRVGFLLTAEIRPRLTDEELAEWEAAIEEYRALHARRN